MANLIILDINKNLVLSALLGFTMFPTDFPQNKLEISCILVFYDPVYK